MTKPQKYKKQPELGAKIRNFGQICDLIRSDKIQTRGNIPLFYVAESAYLYARTLQYLGLTHSREHDVQKLGRLRRKIQLEGGHYRQKMGY